MSGGRGASSRSAVSSRLRSEIDRAAHAVVARPKQVAGLYRAFDLPHELQRTRRINRAQEILSEFTDTVMVGERAACRQDFLARGMLELCVLPNGIGDALAVKAQIEIHTHASRVDLGDATGE